MEEKSKSLFEHFCNTDSDINQHLHCLRYFASKSKTIVEMGVRSINSTWAFLDAKPKKLTSYDIVHPKQFGQEKHLEYCEQYAKENNVDFSFVHEDVLQVKLKTTDFLFIDTWHVYDQLIMELNMHSPKIKKWIAMHDTETFGEKGEISSYSFRDKKERLGLKFAINEFLQNNSEWKLYEHYTYNNGLTILERI